jgi:hypothetical protein
MSLKLLSTTVRPVIGKSVDKWLWGAHVILVNFVEQGAVAALQQSCGRHSTSLVRSGRTRLSNRSFVANREVPLHKVLELLEVSGYAFSAAAEKVWAAAHAASRARHDVLHQNYDLAFSLSQRWDLNCESTEWPAIVGFASNCAYDCNPTCLRIANCGPLCCARN